MNRKLTKLEKSWILYDVGNSAFVLLISTIIPIYFNYLSDSAGLSSVDYLAYWGYAASVVTVVTALIAPVLGTLADTKNFKKPIFVVFLLIGVIGCLLLGASNNWLVFLIIFMIAKIGFTASLVFYDAMLNDVTTEERLDEVSSQGYAWGYIGSCIPFLVSLAVVLGKDMIGLSMRTAMIISFAITAVWWFLVTIPLLKNYKQVHYVERQPNAVAASFKRLWDTLKGMKDDKKVQFNLILQYICYE